MDSTCSCTRRGEDAFRLRSRDLLSHHSPATRAVTRSRLRLLNTEDETRLTWGLCRARNIESSINDSTRTYCRCTTASGGGAVSRRSQDTPCTKSRWKSLRQRGQSCLVSLQCRLSRRLQCWLACRHVQSAPLVPTRATSDRIDPPSKLGYG